MKLSFTTADFKEETWKRFAVFLGWSEKVMTTDLSPNIIVDNPVTYSDFIVKKYGSPVYADLALFNSEAQRQIAESKISAAKQSLENARALADQQAKELVKIEMVETPESENGNG
jgi:hypothetical protein